MATLLRRLLFTLSLVAGADLILFLVLDSGLIGDADRFAAGLHPDRDSVAFARLRSGRYDDYLPQALGLRLVVGSTSLRLVGDEEGLHLLRPGDGQEVLRLSWQAHRTLAEVATALDGQHGQDWRLEAFCAREHQALPATGLALMLADGPLKLRPGQATQLGWAHAVPWTTRFSQSFLHLLRFDFGRDVDGRDIGTRLWQRGARSLAISIPAFLLATLAALVLAQWAVLRGGRLDRHLQTVATVVMSVTSLAWILILRRWLSVELAWFPLRPWSPPLLPLLALPILLWVWIATWPDFLLYRTLLRERLAQPWVTAARARGIGPWRLWWRHVLPNLAAPIASLLAVTLPYLVLGSLLLERIFDIPGLGDAIIRAVEHGDQAFLRAATFLFALGFLGASFLGDLLAAWADPRLRQARPSPQEASA